VSGDAIVSGEEYTVARRHKDGIAGRNFAARRVIAQLFFYEERGWLPGTMKENNMRKCEWLFVVVVLLATACGPSANVEQERNALMELDRQWSQTTKDVEKFVSFYSPDASLYLPGMPIVTGAGPIR
jgi:hypothetical protein